MTITPIALLVEELKHERKCKAELLDALSKVANELDKVLSCRGFREDSLVAASRDLIAKAKGEA